MSSWAFVTRRRAVRLIIITAALWFEGCRMPFFQRTAGNLRPNAPGGTGVYLFSSSPDGGFYVGRSIDGVTWEKVTQTTPLPRADAPYSLEVTLRAPDGTNRRTVRTRSPSIYSAFSVVLFRGEITLVTKKYSPLQRDFRSRVFMSPDGASWREIAQTPGKQLVSPNGALIYARGGKLHSMGGFDSKEWDYVNDVYVSDDGASWEKSGVVGLPAADYLEAGASDSGILELNGKIYAFAGTRSNRIFTSSGGLEWEEVKQRPGKQLPRITQPGQFVFKGMLLVPYVNFRPGGRHIEFYFSKDGETWNRRPSGIPRKLGWGVFILDNRVHVMGGDFEIDARRSPKTGERLRSRRWDNRQVWISDDGFNYAAVPLKSPPLPGWAADSPQFLSADF